MSWPLVKLGDIFDITSSKRVHEKDWRSEGIPFYRAREVAVLSREGRVDNELFIDESMYEEFKHKYGIPQEGDLLVTAVGTLGKIYAVKAHDRFYFKDASVIWLRKKSEVDTSYVWHALNSVEVQRFIQNSSGATVGAYTISRANETEIPLPPLEEQKRIAAILDKADAIRRKRQQAIKLADDFLRSVFLEMFGDPVTNPKGWEVKPLISLCTDDFQNGAYFPPESYADDGVEMVHMSDAFYDTVQRGALRRVRCSLDDVKKYGLNETQLLISRRSLTYEGAAKPSLIPASDEPLIFESSLIRVSPSNDKMLTRFLFQYLSTESVKEHHIRKYVTGATIKGISQKNLEKISVYVPPIGLQEEFSLVVSKVGRLIQNGMASSIVDSRLFQSLSQKAFSGTL